jgi:hypothetical protein
MGEQVTTGQRAMAQQWLTAMESEVAVLFMRAENLTWHVEAELVRPVMHKLAETVEALRQLKVCMQMSEGEEKGSARLEELLRLRRMKGEGDDGAVGA